VAGCGHPAGDLVSRARRGRRVPRPSRWVCALAVAALALAAAPVAPASGTPVTCAGASDPIPATIVTRLVVLVHGWRADASTMLPLARDLTSRLGSRSVIVLRFDYGDRNTAWAGDPAVHSCLATYLAKAAMAYRQGGGDGKVIAIGHSMGGLAIRFAAARSVGGTPVVSSLAGVINIGTPYQGSPWGGTAVARQLESVTVRSAGTTDVLPPADSRAVACLAPVGRRPPNCGTAPYLPQGVPLTQIGAQIVIHRTLVLARDRRRAVGRHPALWGRDRAAGLSPRLPRLRALTHAPLPGDRGPTHDPLPT
jgi:pimeloyl-ACP methyl ester carboxylesterase